MNQNVLEKETANDLAICCSILLIYNGKCVAVITRDKEFKDEASTKEVTRNIINEYNSMIDAYGLGLDQSEFVDVVAFNVKDVLRPFQFKYKLTIYREDNFSDIATKLLNKADINYLIEIDTNKEKVNCTIVDSFTGEDIENDGIKEIIL